MSTAEELSSGGRSVRLVADPLSMGRPPEHTITCSQDAGTLMETVVCETVAEGVIVLVDETGIIATSTVADRPESFTEGRR